MGRRARTAAERGTKYVKLGLAEIDQMASARSKDLTKEEDVFLQTLQIGGGFGTTDLAKLDSDVDPSCSYCGSPDGSVDHIVIDCPFFKPVREQADSELVEVDTRKILPCIRRARQ